MKIKIKDKDKKPRVKSQAEEKSDTKMFFDVLEKSASFDPREPQKMLVDSGLVVLKKNSSAKVRQIISLLPKGKAILMKLDNPYFADEFLKKLVMVNREGQWLIVNCSCDPAPMVIQILKQINQGNKFTIPNFEGKELFTMRMNSESRVVFMIGNDTLEKEITYPYFMDLFGPILRTNK